MKKKNSNQLPIIPIGLAICFLGVITFLFLHFATQNEQNMATPTPPVVQSPEPTETPDNNGENNPDIKAEIVFTSPDINISRGSLVLVDKDHRYDVSESELDLVYVSQVKTVPFMMRPDYVTRLSQTVIAPLDEMMQAYIDEVGENTIYIYIAYRDEAAQQKTLDDFIASIGREAALRRVALPGHSEHHTGFAMDFGAMVNGVHHTFDYREPNHHEPTKWFALNSYRFGFVLSFPEDRVEEGGTIYEPWHYRYVGYPHSHIMFDNNWPLSEYLEELRSYTSSRPLKVEYDNYSYEIYFTTDSEIIITYDTLGIDASADTDIITSQVQAALSDRISISGNNIDGFIVTIKN